MKGKTYSSKELLQKLYNISKNKRVEKQANLPRFTFKEALLIRDLIFQRPKDLIYFHLADHIGNLTEIGKSRLFNSRGYRKYNFLKNFIESGGNATKAAIASGYSPRSARQQGHRMLKQIQGLCGREYR